MRDISFLKGIGSLLFMKCDTKIMLAMKRTNENMFSLNVGKFIVLEVSNYINHQYL